MRPVLLGFFYFASAFVAGTILGVLRTILVEPQLGLTAALLLEIPVILGVCWFAAGHILNIGFNDPPSLRDRSLVGVSAFVLLMAAEFLLGFLLFGYSFTRSIDRFSSGNGLIGFAAQVAFALFPAFRRSRKAPR